VAHAFSLMSALLQQEDSEKVVTRRELM